MNKQSVVLTKWVSDSNTLLEDYNQLSLLTALPNGEWLDNNTFEIRKSLNIIDNMIANSPVGTKFKLTLERVELNV